MSEDTETTQPSTPAEDSDLTPTQPFELGDTQPVKTARKKKRRWLSILIGILGFLLLIGLGGFGGYTQGIRIRLDAEKSVIQKQLTEQFGLALVDITFGRYETAKDRLEWIIDNDPSFPGAQEKLTEVLVQSSIPTATSAPTLTSTPDNRNAEKAFQDAKTLIQIQDWPNALRALDLVRKLDPTYNTAQVDGMYYFALRNYGVDLIQNKGNLEGGIYQLTLAERFGPLDNTAISLRNIARTYIIGASFWELDWEKAYMYFSDIQGSYISDGTMTADARFRYAAMRYGDLLFERGDYCGAIEKYDTAGDLDDVASKNYNAAYPICFPPTDPVATEPPAPTP